MPHTDPAVMTTLRMSQVLVPKAYTVVPVDADKRTVIQALADTLVTCKRIEAKHVATIVDEALKREVVGSTGIGHGIAIPHCRTSLSDEIICSYGHCQGGVDFDSLDGEPVHSIFLLITPPALKDQHLQLMKSFASQIRKEHFCDFLHQVSSAQALHDLLVEFENH